MPTYPTYKLGEICETTSGGTPNRKNDAYYGGIIPWVKSGELGKGIIYDTEEKITEQAVKESSAKIFPKGTLLIALYGATIGKLGFLGVPAATNQAVCGIFENEKIDLQFLSYYLFHKRNDLIAQGTGGAQPNISQTILKNLSIPLPPLATQHAIVTRIETLFAELDKAVQNLRTAQQQLKTYRQTVLNHWLNNDEGKWETVKLGEVAEKIQIGPFGTQLHKSDYINGGIPLINPMHINNNKIQPDKSFSVSEEKYKELSNYYLQKGDVVLGRRGEMGRCAVVSEKEDGMLCGTGSLYIRGGDALFADYLCRLLSSQKIILYFENASSGTTMSNLNRGIIENCAIPFPPLPDQHRIVQEIESRLSQATATETYIENALQQAEALRQSILKKAFSGELV